MRGGCSGKLRLGSWYDERDVLFRVEKMQAGARDQGTKLSLRCFHFASCQARVRGWRWGLWLVAANGPCLKPSVWEGGLSLLSTHPAADPARRGGERAVAWPQAQESRGCSRALGRVGAGGAASRRRVGVRPGQELWLLPSAAFLEGPVGVPPAASPLS